MAWLVQYYWYLVASNIMSSNSNTADIAVWIPYDDFGFVPVRLIKAVHSPTNAKPTTNESKQQYQAEPLCVGRDGTLMRQKNMAPFEVELSKDDQELLDPVKGETMRMACNNLSDLPSTDAGLVLYHLQKRFRNGQVFTRAGNSLISVNPSVRLPDQTPDAIFRTLQHYKNTPEEDCDPHLYSFAGNMYHGVCMNGQSHFVTVRGNKGAGKSDCVERIIEYLVNVSRGVSNSELGPRLCSVCSVLDVFTHVRSLTNVSSSRCCQKITTFYHANGLLQKWHFDVLLLNTSGLMGSTRKGTEQNFHIFYYLLAGMTDEELEKLGIVSREAHHFPCLTRHDDLWSSQDEEEESLMEEYGRLLDAVDALNIGAEMMEMLRVVVAIMHLSALEFESTGKNSKGDMIHPVAVKECTTVNVSTVETIAKLLGLGTEMLRSFLCTNGDTIWSAGRAKLRCRIFANELYQASFRGLVTVLNTKGSASMELSKPGDVADKKKRFISIIDSCVARTNDEGGGMNLQELCNYYLHEKLQHLRDDALAKELQLYHSEDVVNVSPFWPGNITAVKHLDEVMSVLDSTKNMKEAEINPALLARLKKIAANVHGEEQYDWKNILLETWVMHASQEQSNSMLETSTHNLLKQGFQSTVTDGRVQTSIINQHNRLLDDHATLGTTTVREVCCVRANALFRPLTMAPAYCLDQLNCMDVTSPIRMGRVGFAHTMTCVEFYHWLYRVVPSLLTESPRYMTINHDSMTKMFMTVAGCASICNLLEKKKGTKYHVKAINIRIGKTQVFIKNDKDLSRLIRIRDSLWTTNAVLIQSFCRMCSVRCELARQTKVWIENQEMLKYKAEELEMKLEDKRSAQLREQRNKETQLRVMALKEEKRKQTEARQKMQKLEEQMVKVEQKAQMRRDDAKRRVDETIASRQKLRTAVITLQSFARRILCQSRVECALCCIALLDARNLHALKRAVNRGSRTLLRWRIGTSRLLKMLLKARKRIGEIQDADQTVNRYLDEEEQWV